MNLINKKFPYLIFIGIFLLAACTINETEFIKVTETLTGQTQIIQTPATSTTFLTSPTPSITTTPALEGPLLLVQTDVNTYHLIDLGSNWILPYEPPGNGQEHHLSRNLSPNGEYILFFLPDIHKALIIQILTGEITHSYDLNHALTTLDAQKIAKEASANLTNTGFAYEMLEPHVDNSILASLQEIQWYKSDQSTLIVREGSATSTHLFLDDHQTINIKQLEELPGLVEDYWVKNSTSQILLRKGYINQPNIWQDDRYYILDLINNTELEITLPENINSPSVYWLSDNQIGIIHQRTPFGGENFSIFNLDSMITTLVIPGQFNTIQSFNGNILAISQLQNTDKTIFYLSQATGEVINTKEIAGFCTYKAKISYEQILLNCENESVLLEGSNLLIQPFRDRITIISRTPDGKHFIIVTDTSEIFLLDDRLENWQLIKLNDFPYEIRWLPDSTGFIYRAVNQLIYYDLENQKNQVLFTSDFFADYRNLNAIWIKYP
jgi:hypothetical protein